MLEPFAPPADAVPTDPGWPATRHVKPLGVRRRVTTSLLGLSAVLAGAEAGAIFVMVSLYSGPMMPLIELTDRIYLSADPDGALLLAGGVFALTTLIAPLLFVATAISWALWEYRAMRNLRALAGAGHVPEPRFSPAWAVGTWFIPFLNLIMPYYVHREMFALSDPEEVRPTGFILLWWGCWIGAMVASAFMQRATNADLDVVLALSLVYGALLIAASLLGARLVRETSVRQQALIRRVEGREQDALQK